MATLAVGIAGPSSMLALAAGTTSPLPGDEDRRVVRMSIVDRTGRVHPVVEPLLEAWLEGAVGPADPLTTMAAYQYESSSEVPFGGGGESPAGRYRGVYATPEVFEMLGVHDVVAKSMGSTNPYNVVRATFDALVHQENPRGVAARRNKKVSEIVSRRRDGSVAGEAVAEA